MNPSQISPGVLDGSAQHAFSLGACGALAIALHDHTGWPLVLVTDAASAYSPNAEANLATADEHARANPANRAGLGASGLHWLVLHPTGKLLDVDGLHSPEEVLAEYEGHGDEDCDGRVAIAQAGRDHALEEYVDAKGEPIALQLAATFVMPVLAQIPASHPDSASGRA